jgi:hypothetical protein
VAPGRTLTPTYVRVNVHRTILFFPRAEPTQIFEELTGEQGFFTPRARLHPWGLTLRASSNRCYNIILIPNISLPANYF